MVPPYIYSVPPPYRDHRHTLGYHTAPPLSYTGLPLYSGLPSDIVQWDTIHYQLVWEVTPADAQPINLPVPSNSIHKNHNNPLDSGSHSLMIKTHIPKISSNVSRSVHLTVKKGRLTSFY